MMNFRASNIYKYIFSSGDIRSKKVKKNVIAMLFIKVGNIALGLLLIPLTLDYVDSETYGLWLTLSSMVSWMSFFDIGINNGLKNKLAEAFAVDDYNLGKQYVSTSYALLSIIFLPLMILLLLIMPFINWNELLHINIENYRFFSYSIAIIIIYFCINSVLSTINVVLSADQKPASAAFRTLLQQLIALILVVFFTYVTEGSLLNLCIALCIAPILVVLLFNFTLFRGRYKNISPSLSHIDFGLIPSLFKIGLQFFVIQMAGIIQFQLTNFLIIRYYGAIDVTAYNISYKYFSISYMVWGIMIGPLWAACTDAYVKGDLCWIRSVAQKYTKIMFIFFAVSVILLFLSGNIYHIWIGDNVNIEFMLSLWMMIYMIVLIFSSLYVTILNGIGMLRVQSIACLISPIIYLVVFFICYNLKLGVYSVLIASIIANFNGLILAPIQCYKLMKKNCIDYIKI